MYSTMACHDGCPETRTRMLMYLEARTEHVQRHLRAAIAATAHLWHMSPPVSCIACFSDDLPVPFHLSGGEWPAPTRPTSPPYGRAMLQLLQLLQLPQLLQLHMDTRVLNTWNPSAYMLHAGFRISRFQMLSGLSRGPFACPEPWTISGTPNHTSFFFLLSCRQLTSSCCTAPVHLHIASSNAQRRCRNKAWYGQCHPSETGAETLGAYAACLIPKVYLLSISVAKTAVHGIPHDRANCSPSVALFTPGLTLLPVTAKLLEIVGFPSTSNQSPIKVGSHGFVKILILAASLAYSGLSMYYY